MSNELLIEGTPLIGLYMVVTEEFAILGIQDDSVKALIEEELDVSVFSTTLLGSKLVGCLAVGNSKGIVVSDRITREEYESLKKIGDVLTVPSRMTCLGNVIAVNDRGGIAHPEIEDRTLEKIQKFLEIEIIKGTIGGMKTVGTSVVATNRGALLNPNAREWESKKVEEIMKVPWDTGTVNFGSELVKTGVVANTKGYIVGADTTGFEKGRIEEALGFI